MTNYEKLTIMLREHGMDYKWTKMFVKKLRDDENAFKMSDEEKEWALKRGFFPGRIALYGLNDDNYNDYLPDYNYFMIHPMNHHFRIWINDKLSLKYTLNSNGCEASMPKYYLYVENDGNYTYLFDIPENIKKDKDFIYNLLKETGRLAIKPNSGTSGGLGFMKIELRDGSLYENNSPITKARFDEIVSMLKNHIITEYVNQHSELAKVWDKSECTLRVIMMKNPVDNACDKAKWSNIVSFARFGTEMSGGASNLSQGGIGVGFDFETGAYKDFGIKYNRFCIDSNTIFYKHPDTGYAWKNKYVPNWEYVKDMIYKICNHISSLSYLGFDVIITEDGMKLCEINTHPACDFAQVMCGPVFKKPGALKFFESKGLNNFSRQDFYEIYMKCQDDEA